MRPTIPIARSIIPISTMSAARGSQLTSAVSRSTLPMSTMAQSTEAIVSHATNPTISTTSSLVKDRTIVCSTTQVSSAAKVIYKLYIIIYNSFNL